jgi:hypothetical protein
MTTGTAGRAARAFAVPAGLLRLTVNLAMVGVAFTTIAVVARDPAGTPLASWLGHRIVSSHAFVVALGSETFTAQGAPAYAGWLGALVTLAAASLQGLGNMAGTALFLVALTFALDRARRRGAEGLALVAVAAFCAVACASAIAAPARALDWLLLSVVLWLIERGTARSIYACVGVTVLWCNADALGVAVPFVLLLWAGGASIADGRFSSRARRLAIAGTFAALATTLTPATLELPAHAIAWLGLDPRYWPVRPWQPALAFGHTYTLAVVPLIVAAVAFGMWQRRRAADALLVVAASLLVLLNGRYAPEFVLAASPVIVPRAFAALGTARRAASSGFLPVGFLVAAAVIAPVSLATGSDARATASSPLVVALAADGSDHRLFCTNLDACDTFVATGDPHVRVFMDSRVAAYPGRVVADQDHIAHALPGWRTLLRTWHVDAVVARRGQPVAELLALTPLRWRVAASDGDMVLFERPIAP